jgi:cytochrome c oxidase accessory protein FixG
MSVTEGSGSFRDTLATIDKRGRRIWVYPNKPQGKFHSARAAVAVVLLAFLFGAPFIKINGNPLLLFDVLDRRFFLLGHIFWPQDLYLFVLAAIATVVFVFLFTAAWGRLFCGWICPQTIFMEMVFRKLEFWLEGNGPRQRELDRAPMSAGKFVRKIAKHLLFYGLSFLIGNTFLAYFIGVERLADIITSPPSEHLTGLIVMIVFSFLFYGVFAWFREQACTLVCPYGRLQSVLLDANSIVIAYDFKRGDPRGAWPRGGRPEGNGDCIDCGACVRVCPTGIDIRNGTQLECVNCTACIDACDRVMERMKLPLGLIRYASFNQISLGKKMSFTPRMKLYVAVLALLVGAITTLLVLRTSVEATILRTTGSLYEELSDGTIRNIYSVKVTNKSGKEMAIDLHLNRADGQITVLGPVLDVKPQGQAQTVIAIQIPRTSLFSTNSLVQIDVMSEGKVLQHVRTTFVGPPPASPK